MMDDFQRETGFLLKLKWVNSLFPEAIFFYPGGVHNLFLYHGIERIKLKGYYANKVPP